MTATKEHIVGVFAEMKMLEWSNFDPF